MATDSANKVGYLKTVEIFQDLSDQELQALESSVTKTPCAAGKIFYSPEAHLEHKDSQAERLDRLPPGRDTDSPGAESCQRL